MPCCQRLRAGVGCRLRMTGNDTRSARTADLQTLTRCLASPTPFLPPLPLRPQMSRNAVADGEAVLHAEGAVRAGVRNRGFVRLSCLHLSVSTVSDLLRCRRAVLE